MWGGWQVAGEGVADVAVVATSHTSISPHPGPLTSSSVGLRLLLQATERREE